MAVGFLQPKPYIVFVFGTPIAIQIVDADGGTPGTKGGDEESTGARSDIVTREHPFRKIISLNPAMHGQSFRPVEIQKNVVGRTSTVEESFRGYTNSLNTIFRARDLALGWNGVN